MSASLVDFGDEASSVERESLAPAATIVEQTPSPETPSEAAVDTGLADLRERRERLKKRWHGFPITAELLDDLGLAADSAFESELERALRPYRADVAETYNELHSAKMSSLDAKIAAGEYRVLGSDPTSPSAAELSGAYGAWTRYDAHAGEQRQIILRPGESVELDELADRYSNLADQAFDAIEHAFQSAGEGH